MQELVTENWVKNPKLAIACLLTNVDGTNIELVSGKNIESFVNKNNSSITVVGRLRTLISQLKVL